jgi:UPF0042 nucleotide-binding protein
VVKLSKLRICIITGLSGSGKSTAIRALEDEGFFCLDNLPVTLLQTFIELVQKSSEKIKDVAIVIDIRSRDFADRGETFLKDLKDKGHNIEVIFLDATDEVLIRRFSETRRRHPALKHGTIEESIQYERQHLLAFRQLATIDIDTSELNVHQLKELIISIINGESSPRLFTLHFQSFGYRYGVPIDSDLVIDVRFLSNPYFVPELKSFSGLEKKVQDYVLTHTDTVEFLKRLQNFIEFLLPFYKKEGKAYLTISIGCTGGRHRSVAIV